MSCRTTPAGSAFTSFARISSGAGNPLSDVATLSTFHALRRSYQDNLRDNQAASMSRTGYATQFRDMMPYPYHGMEAAEAYARMLADLRQQVTDDTGLTDARRASLLARLTAAETAEVPDHSTLYALANLNRTVARAREGQAEFIANAAEAMGMTDEETLARFRELEDSIDRDRSAGNPDTYTDENRAEVRRLGMTDEPGVVHAWATLNARAREVTAALNATRPRLINNHTRITPSRVPDTDLEVVGYGFDERSRRMEVITRNTVTGEETIQAIREGSSRDIEGLQGTVQGWRRDPNSRSWSGQHYMMSPGDYFGEQLSSSYRRYSTQEDADAAGYASRCALCGQFATAGHSCPDRFAAARVYNMNSFDRSAYVRTSAQRINYQTVNGNGDPLQGEFTVDLPLVNDYRAGFRETGMILLQNVSGSGDWRDGVNNDQNARRGWVRVNGDIALTRAEDGTITANTDQLRCTCWEYRQNNYHCRHTRAMGEAAALRAVPPRRAVSSMTPAEREARLAEAQARAEAAAASDWTRNETGLADAAKTWQENAEVSYMTDTNAFTEAYNKATEARAAAGKPVIPYMTENALGGLATRASGQAFGMEIEYDFPNDWTQQQRNEANARIGAALKAANLTDHDTMQPYHASASNGFIDSHTKPNGKGAWSWERDGSVAGELVSPGMYDEPETWANLQTALTILKDNGAIASPRAGAHVHVGTAFFGQDTAKYAELARLVTQHEAVMYRVASDPARGTHRGMTQGFNYSSPAPAVAPEGFSDANALKRWQGTRTRALNLNAVRVDDQYKSSHPEFRIFDSSLDAGTMQAQVKLAVAMTHAAARNAAAGGTSRGKEEIGVHADRAKLRGRRRATEDDLKEETSTFRSLMDTLFTRAADKEQLTAVFANTSWVKLKPSQRGRRW
jgi:hypothetical protein